MPWTCHSSTGFTYHKQLSKLAKKSLCWHKVGLLTKQRTKVLLIHGTHMQVNNVLRIVEELSIQQGQPFSFGKQATKQPRYEHLTPRTPALQTISPLSFVPILPRYMAKHRIANSKDLLRPARISKVAPSLAAYVSRKGKDPNNIIYISARIHNNFIMSFYTCILTTYWM